eukprot:1142640-Pelagomonas_calceolata.AAC.8
MADSTFKERARSQNLPTLGTTCSGKKQAKRYRYKGVHRIKCYMQEKQTSLVNANITVVFSPQTQVLSTYLAICTSSQQQKCCIGAAPPNLTACSKNAQECKP